MQNRRRGSGCVHAVHNYVGSFHSALWLLMLSACSGGGGSSPPPAPTPPPPADFTEAPAGTFTGRDNTNLTLSQAAATADLIVLSLGGNDRITTGSGGDLIRGGAGADVIDAGDGDDVIVIVGVTAAAQYTDADITDPGGSGADLSPVLALDNLNGQAVSEAIAGEAINGGAGAGDSLVVYGDIDISPLLIENVPTLRVNSTVLLSAHQLTQFLAVIGNGESVLRVAAGSDGVITRIDLSSIAFSNIAELGISGDVWVALSGMDTLAGISRFAGGDEMTLVLQQDAGASAEFSLAALSNLVGSASSVQVEQNVTLMLDDVASLAALGVSAIGGDGLLEIDSSSADALPWRVLRWMTTSASSTKTAPWWRQVRWALPCCLSPA